jgi:phosphoglycolate phosphatase-like HAD superfamily hydrolase/ADP-ribose pyrophosphatase YjhB (NUDIX family)
MRFNFRFSPALRYSRSVIQNIIFDWSGTLVDDLPAVLAATNYVFSQCGLEAMSLDQFRAEFCLPFKHFYDRFAPGIPIEKLEESFHGHFGQVQQHVTEIPHAREFLIFCREHKIRTFLLSTVSPLYYKLQAAVTGFDQYIDRPYAGIWDKRAKICELLTENQLDPKQTIFIGDMQHDIDTARHGGIGSCAVLTGYNRLDQLRASEPDLIVEHLGELREILERNQFELRPGRQVLDTEHGPHPICTVGALIWNSRDEALMVRTQKWSGLWGIPGGKIKFGEPSLEALKREIKEETDLDVTDMKFEIVQDCIHSTEFYREAHFVLLNYTCRVSGGASVKLNDEAQEFRWLSPAEALKMPLNKPTRILLEHVTAQKTWTKS